MREFFANLLLKLGEWIRGKEPESEEDGAPLLAEEEEQWQPEVSEPAPSQSPQALEEGKPPPIHTPDLPPSLEDNEEWVKWGPLESEPPAPDSAESFGEPSKEPTAESSSPRFQPSEQARSKGPRAIGREAREKLRSVRAAKEQAEDAPASAPKLAKAPTPEEVAAAGLKPEEVTPVAEEGGFRFDQVESSHAPLPEPGEMPTSAVEITQAQGEALESGAIPVSKSDELFVTEREPEAPRSPFRPERNETPEDVPGEEALVYPPSVAEAATHRQKMRREEATERRARKEQGPSQEGEAAEPDEYDPTRAAAVGWAAQRAERGMYESLGVPADESARYSSQRASTEGESARKLDEILRAVSDQAQRLTQIEHAIQQGIGMR